MQPAGRGHRVLLVTIDVELVWRVQRLLAGSGFALEVKSTVPEAGIAVLFADAGDVEVVVCDLELPGFDYSSMRSYATCRCPASPTILLVQDDSPEALEPLLDEGAFDCCPRGESGSARLLLAIRRAIAQYAQILSSMLLLDTVSRLRQANEHRRAIEEVAKAMTSTRDLDLTLQLILEKAKEVVGAEVSTLFLFEKETSELVYRAARGFDTDAMRSIRLRVGEGVAGWVAERRVPLLVHDAYGDPRFSPKADDKSGFRTRSLMAAPLVHGEDLFGVVEVVNPIQGELFEEEDLGALAQFAAFGAIALENAKAYGRIEAEKARLASRVRELEVRFDAAEKDRQVQAITESDYFIRLRARADAIRRKF